MEEIAMAIRGAIIAVLCLMILGSKAQDDTATATDAVPAAATDAVPAATDAVPAATDAVPAATDAVPTATDAVPVATDTVPAEGAVDDATATVTETAPATSTVDSASDTAGTTAPVDTSTVTDAAPAPEDTATDAADAAAPADVPEEADESTSVISIVKGQSIANSVVGGATEGLLEGVVEALVGDIPVAGDVATGVAEDAPTSEVVTSVPVIEVLGSTTDIVSNPANVAAVTGSGVENIAEAPSLGPVFEVFSGGDVSEPSNFVETITNVPATDTFSVGPVLDTLGADSDDSGLTGIADDKAGSNAIEDLPVDDVTGVVAPPGKVTARTLLRLVLMRRLGMLKS